MQTSQGYRGGFKADRDFGFSIPKLFPGLEPVDGVVLIVRIDNPKNLNLYSLAKVLIHAANGGIKKAVVVKNGTAKVMPIMNLWMLVDEGQELKAQFKLERRIRTGV